MHISREHKVLLMKLPYLALEQGVILDREPLSVKVIVTSGPRVCPVPTNFIQKYLQCNTMKFVYKITEVCMQNEENQCHKRRLVFTMNRVSGIFICLKQGQGLSASVALL